MILDFNDLIDPARERDAVLITINARHFVTDNR